MAGSNSFRKVIAVALINVGIDEKEIENLIGKSRMKAWLNFLRNTISRLINGEKDADLQLLGRFFSTLNLNYPPRHSWTTIELVSFYKQGNPKCLSKLVELLLIRVGMEEVAEDFKRVGMEEVAEDFKERVKVAAGFENSDLVKLWSFLSMPYLVRKLLVATGKTEVLVPPSKTVFPTSIGWIFTGKRKAPAVADEAGPSSLKRIKTDLEVPILAAPIHKFL